MNRLRAKVALAEALPWREELGGVMDLMLDYAELKPISFSVSPGLTHPVESDGTTAVRVWRDSDSYRFHPARCAYPLEMCVPHWSIRLDEEDGPADAIDVGVTGTDLWADLCCDRSMFARSAGSKEQGYYAQAHTKLIRAVHAGTGQPFCNREEGPTVLMYISPKCMQTLNLNAPLPTATVHVSVDLDSETITWTVQTDDRPITHSLRVPDLRNKHAYVDLTPRARATIIQHPNPWLF